VAAIGTALLRVRLSRAAMAMEAMSAGRVRSLICGSPSCGLRPTVGSRVRAMADTAATEVAAIARLRATADRTAATAAAEVMSAEAVGTRPAAVVDM
jgi:hypothetical protein